LSRSVLSGWGICLGVYPGGLLSVTLPGCGIRTSGTRWLRRRSLGQRRDGTRPVARGKGMIRSECRPVDAAAVFSASRGLNNRSEPMPPDDGMSLDRRWSRRRRDASAAFSSRCVFRPALSTSQHPSATTRREHWTSCADRLWPVWLGSCTYGVGSSATHQLAGSKEKKVIFQCRVFSHYCRRYRTDLHLFAMDIIIPVTIREPASIRPLQLSYTINLYRLQPMSLDRTMKLLHPKLHGRTPRGELRVSPLGWKPHPDVCFLVYTLL